MTGPSLPGLDTGQVALDVLRAGGSVRLVARGHSMTPAIRDGDRVELEPLGSPPRPGDVLACEADGSLVIHRLVGRPGGRLELRGDAAPARDQPLAPGAALGRVVRVERGGRPVLLGLGPERVLLAWLSRHGVLRALARCRELVRSVPIGSGFRLALPVREGTGGRART